MPRRYPKDASADADADAVVAARPVGCRARDRRRLHLPLSIDRPHGQLVRAGRRLPVVPPLDPGGVGDRGGDRGGGPGSITHDVGIPAVQPSTDRPTSWLAPACTPAMSSTSWSEMPVHFAFPTSEP